MPTEVELDELQKLFIKKFSLSLREVNIIYSPSEAFGNPEKERKLCVLLHGPYESGEKHQLEKEKYHAHFDMTKRKEAEKLYEELGHKLKNI